MNKEKAPALLLDHEEVKSLMNTIIDQKYRVVTKLNSSSIYFEAYLANVIGTKEQVAVKMEKVRGNVLTLYNEYRVLRTLQANEKRCDGIPRSIWFGIEEDNNILIQELLGPQLDSLLRTCNKSFSLKTVIMLGEHMLARLETLHGSGYVHRDIKPQNFCIGLMDKSTMVYLTNFGSAKQYKNTKTGAHKPYSENKQMIGTSNFSSVNSHLGIEPSRRDDLESLAYVLIYFFKGVLPWQSIHSNSTLEKLRKVMESKMTIPAEVLCRGMPDIFAMFLTYCKELKYDERPDYRYLKDLLRQAAAEYNITIDNNYDWMMTNKLIEQNSRYQFRHMAISFRSSTGQNNMGKSINDQTIAHPVTPPRFKISRSMVEEDVLALDDDDDNIVPHDLGISALSNEIPVPLKSLMTSVVRSNSESHGNAKFERNFTSDCNQFEQYILQEKPLLMQKLNSVPLPVVNDLEEERNILETGVDVDSMKRLEFKNSPTVSFSKKKSTGVGTPYNIILTEEDGTNYEFDKNGKM